MIPPKEVVRSAKVHLENLELSSLGFQVVAVPSWKINWKAGSPFSIELLINGVQ
jgi:hypothetical protein